MLRQDFITGASNVHDSPHAPDDPSLSAAAQALSAAAQARRQRSYLRWAIQAILITVVVVFLVVSVRHSLDQLRRSPEVLAWDRIGWTQLVLACVLSAAALVPAGIGWLQILRDFSFEVPTPQIAYAYFLGHLGKYVPGKAMAVVLRVEHLHRHGGLVRPAILSVFIETLTSIASGSILGALLLQTMAVPMWLKACSLACIPLAAAIFIPGIVRPLITKIARTRLGSMPDPIAHAIRWTMMLRCGAWSLLGWLLYGTSAHLMLMAIDPEPNLVSWQAWCACVSSMSLATLAGFLSMIPGGAGARELVATWGMATLAPVPVALAAAILTRLAMLASEILIVGLLAIGVRTPPHTPSTLRRSRDGGESDQASGI